MSEPRPTAARDQPGPKKGSTKPSYTMAQPRKPKDQFRGTNGFAEPVASSLDPLQVAQFALEHMGSPFPSAEQLRATGRQELKTVPAVKQRIQLVKKQQDEELDRAYQFRNTENLDLVQQQWLSHDLDTWPVSSVVVSKQQPISRTDEASVLRLAQERRLQEHATDDLVSRVRYSHLQTLTALWKKLGDAESNDRRAALNVKFPQTPEEFIAIRETAQKLRYAKFLKAPPDQQNYQKLQNGWGEDVQPLLREIHYNQEFRALVEKTITASTSRDPRQRR